VDTVSIRRLQANLDQPAFRYMILKDDILSWALDPNGGGLPAASAMAFTAWLDENWNDFSEDTEVTVEQVLQGAVADWCGGRTL
jgi:hypothetical protein